MLTVGCLKKIFFFFEKFNFKRKLNKILANSQKECRKIYEKLRKEKLKKENGKIDWENK